VPLRGMPKLALYWSGFATTNCSRKPTNRVRILGFVAAETNEVQCEFLEMPSQAMRPSQAASFFCATRLHGEFSAPRGTGLDFTIESSHARATRLSVCAVLGVLLVAVSVFSLSVAAKAIAEPAGASDAVCSELSERRDRLHAEIARLHAETALVEADLVLLCAERRNRNQTDVGLPPLSAPPSQSPGGTADEAIGPGSHKFGAPFEPLQLLEPARSAVVPTGNVRVRYTPRGASRGFDVSVVVGERSRCGCFWGATSCQRSIRRMSRRVLVHSTSLR
jgi:hypothetical protein